MFPTPPLHTLPSCRPSAGQMTGLSSLERARNGDPPIKMRSKHALTQSGPGPRDADLHMRAACRADRRTLQCKSPSVLGRQKLARATQKQREAVLKRWGGAERRTWSEGRKIATSTTTAKILDNWRAGISTLAIAPSFSIGFGVRRIKEKKELGRCTCPSFRGIDEKLIARKFVHPFRRQIMRKSRPR
jgi:hypothetical protein